MKEIVKIFLLIAVLPTLAIAASSQCDDITNQNLCNSNAGCGYTNGECTSCGKTYYNPGDKDSNGCKQCTNKDSIPENATQTGFTESICPWKLECPVGTYYNTNNTENNYSDDECTKCSGSTYSDVITTVTFNDEKPEISGITQCKPCSTDGYKVNEDYTQCVPRQFICDSGKYLQKSKTECSACPAGYYCDGGTFEYNTAEDQGKKTCPKGSYCPAESSSPSPCPAGSTSDGGEKAKTIKDCYMDLNTSFCDASKNTCVSFEDIFGNIKINYNLN